jgi:hypothetical protein
MLSALSSSAPAVGWESHPYRTKGNGVTSRALWGEIAYLRADAESLSSADRDPAVPPKVSVHLTGFLTQIQFQDVETQISGIITQTVQPTAGTPGKISVILDLDAFELKTTSPEPDQVLERFADLRIVKNRYFFARTRIARYLLRTLTDLRSRTVVPIQDLSSDRARKAGKQQF